MKQKRVLCCGSSGFIASHLVSFLKGKGYWVRGVDIKKYEYGKEKSDQFWQLDLTDYKNCLKATKDIDEVYNLAAQMGGMFFISQNHLASFKDSNLINTNMTEACKVNKVKRIFFSSSACVYPISKQNSLKKNVMKEEDAYPADPNEAYGWEKLFAEQRYQAYDKAGYFKARIARFGNCYGPEGTFAGGREKVPAALCRKVAEAKNGGEIEMWGDGKQTRSFMYVDDCVRGIYKIMQSKYNIPINLGSDEVITINQLAKIIIRISGKKLKIKHIKGPQGIRSRYINHDLANKLLKWEPKISLQTGLENTYYWILEQMK